MVHIDVLGDAVVDGVYRRSGTTTASRVRAERNFFNVYDLKESKIKFVAALSSPARRPFEAAGLRESQTRHRIPARQTKNFSMAACMITHEVDDVEHWLSSPSARRSFGPIGITVRTFGTQAGRTRTALIAEVPDWRRTRTS